MYSEYLIIICYKIKSNEFVIKSFNILPRQPGGNVSGGSSGYICTLGTLPTRLISDVQQ